MVWTQIRPLETPPRDQNVNITKDVCKKSPPPYGAKNLWRRLFAHVLGNIDMLVLGSVRGRRLFAHVYWFFNENAMQHHPNGTSKAHFLFQYQHGKTNIFETMTFHDFGPCRAPKMKPSRRRILIVYFCFKTPARIKIPPFQTTSKHQNHSNTTVK